MSTSHQFYFLVLLFFVVLGIVYKHIHFSHDINMIILLQIIDQNVNLQHIIYHFCSGILAPFSFIIVHATQLWSIIRPKEIIIFHLPLRPWSIDLIYMQKPNLQLHVWDDEIMQSTYLLFLHCTSAKNALKRWSIIGQNPSTILIHGDYFSINYDINNISFNPKYWCNCD